MYFLYNKSQDNEILTNDNLKMEMELDLQSLFGLHVHSCTHWLRPPHFGLIYEGAIGQLR